MPPPYEGCDRVTGVGQCGGLEPADGGLAALQGDEGTEAEGGVADPEGTRQRLGSGLDRPFADPGSRQEAGREHEERAEPHAGSSQ